MNNDDPKGTPEPSNNQGQREDFWTDSRSAGAQGSRSPRAAQDGVEPDTSSTSPYKGWTRHNSDHETSAPSPATGGSTGAEGRATATPPSGRGQRPGGDELAAGNQSPKAGPAPAAGSVGVPTAVGPSGAPIPVQTDSRQKEKKKVGLGTALAMMLVGSIAAGSITGLVVGNRGQTGVNGSPTAVVNEVLNREPAGNDAPPAEGSIEAVASRVLPAVVSIQVATRRSQAEGSGSIISPDGYVLTNHHVVEGGEDDQSLIQVTMNDGSKYEAEYVASDVNTDVGIIKIKDVSELPYLEFGDSNSLHVGQEVVAVGSPLGLNATVTSGIVSAMNRPVRASQGGGESSLIDAVQTDAAVNPGNSGGPLVDLNGNLVGMNSMIASLSQGGGEAGSIGLGFAIPSNFAKRMADQLINSGEVKHPMIGVINVDARTRGGGALILEVEPDSPAERAGLKKGDVVTKLGDRLIENSDSLIAAVRSLEFGATTNLEVRSEGENESRSVEVTVTSE